MMERITIDTTINNRIETIWNAYNSAEDIMQWNHASDDWHCTQSINDLRIGGKFSSRMEAKDRSSGFDFEGSYVAIEPFKYIAYVMPDGRQVAITFKSKKKTTKITIAFDPEPQNPITIQQAGWQSILDSFKHYVERVYGNSND